jgi:putative ABC transport system permease protein
VRAVVMLLRTQRRQHWKSWLALAALIALAGGFVIAAATTAKRTAAAFPDFVARHGYDAIVYSARPLLPALTRIPQVADVTPVPGPINFPVRCNTCTKPITSGSFGMFEIPPVSLPKTVKLLAGRMPDQSDPAEALASYTLARDKGVRLGSVIQVITPTPAQIKLGRSKLKLSGIPRRSLRVVGLVVTENEFPSGTGDRYDLFVTRAYAAAVNPQALVFNTYYVRLRHGAADQPAFDAALRPLGSLGADDLDIDAAAVQRGIGPQAAGWLGLACLAALAGLAVLGQAAARQFSVDADDHQTLAALGLGARQFVAIGLVRAAVIGTAGAAGAVALAAVLSPLTPVGEARLADGAAGAIVLDPAITTLGAVAAVLVTVVLSVWPAVRNARLRGLAAGQPFFPGFAVSAVMWTGAPPAAVIGVRYALERGRGRRPVPVGTALLGSVLALAALCATAIFGASLARLISTPALYGAPFQAQFANESIGSGAVLTGRLLTSLRHDPAIARITLASVAEIDVNGRPIRAIALRAVRGAALISTVDGHIPRGPRQIALGASTMRGAGVQAGDRVRIGITDPATGARRTVPFVVTGRTSFPPSFGTGGLGTGAAMTTAGLARAQCPAGSGRASCAAKAAKGTMYHVLVTAAPGPAGAAALAKYTHAYSEFVGEQERPLDLVNFGESVNFPLLFGGLLALFGAATTLHLLLVSVARRRTEAGLLKVLGFVRRQVAAVVSWQATAVGLVGIIAGVPLGIAVGKTAWRVFATNFGVVPVAVVEPAVLAALAACVLVVANGLAVLPAIVAARSRPADLLRAE